MPQQRATGIVKFFDAAKGFGFIRRRHGEDVFVHISDVRRSGLTTLFEGQQVDFDIKETPKGPQAENVEAYEFAPRLPPELEPPVPEPVSLASVFYAAALHMLELEDIDPEECVMWHGKTLADVDPKFRVDMSTVEPSEDEGDDELPEHKLEILEKLGELAGLRVALENIMDFVRQHEMEE